VRDGYQLMSKVTTRDGAEDRRKAMRFAFRNAGVDCVTVGYKGPACPNRHRMRGRQHRAGIDSPPGAAS